MRIGAIECIAKFSQSKICDSVSPKRSSDQPCHVRRFRELGTFGKVCMFWIEDGEII
jgi:hypothetical protein